jgi:hypothetical protein
MPKNKKARIEREDLTIVTMPRDLLIQIASRFIVTQFKRPLAGEELRNLALTCKALYKLLFVDDAYILGLAQAKHIQQRLLAPVPAPLEIDTYKNVSWRVSFETDLCVLVLYRAEIIGPAVRRVALWAAGYLTTGSRSRSYPRAKQPPSRVDSVSRQRVSNVVISQNTRLRLVA